MCGGRHKKARCVEKRLELRHKIKEFVKMQGAQEAREKIEAMVSIEIKAQTARQALEQGRYPTPRARTKVDSTAKAAEEATAAQVETATAAQVEAATAQVQTAQVAMMHSVRCTVYGVRCTVYDVRCTV